jgi:hypothetical protein
MLNFFISIIILSTLVFSKSNDNSTNSFITKKEYGKMLYFNPRGIGCNLCHGDNGKGKIIATYKHKNKNADKFKFITIIAPNIISIEFENFRQTVASVKNKSIMPKYFLTNEEINSIYLFLTTQN